MEIQSQTYHHGNLRQALVQAAREMIEEVGPEGFSLRATAKRAGVSATAPAHHFANARALLTAVAEGGFCELGAYIDREPRDDDPVVELHAVATRYVEYAAQHPGLFRLMFREGLTDRTSSSFREASKQALYRASFALAAYQGIPLRAQMESSRHPVVVGMWASLHGLAHLAVEGTVIYSADDKGDEAAVRLIDMLPAILADQWPAKPAANDL